MDDKYSLKSHEAEVWKEWPCLSGLLKSIPQQFQYGLFVAPLRLTCLDAYPDHLVLGTNVGLVYIAHLPSFNLIRLKCEYFDSPITSVSSVSSVDDMIAAGGSDGRVSVFQLPTSFSSEALRRELGPEIRLSQCSPKRFTVNIHRYSVTCLKWSKNGMRLFSGDLSGHVGLIEVNYENCHCTGKIILTVDNPVVQLSYSHQLLAVSCEERISLYSFKDDKTIAVGTKPRSPPGKYGCILIPSFDNPQQDVVYCTRPGKKIWSANMDGNVLYSYIHKKSPDHSCIKLSSKKEVADRILRKSSFGLLNHLKNSVLVTHSENYIVILDISKQVVLGYTEDLHSICDVAVLGDCLFVLNDYKDIICLSPSEPKFGHFVSPKMTSSLHENLNISSLSELKSKVRLPNKHLMDGIARLTETVACKISEITNPTILSGKKITAIPPNDIADSSSEDDFVKDRTETVVTRLLLEDLATESFQKNEVVAERILHNSGSFDSNKEMLQFPLVLNPPLKRKQKRKKNSDDAKLIEKCSSDELDNEGLGNNDSKSCQDFQRDIEAKERVLAEVLDLNCLRMDHEDEARSVSSISDPSFPLCDESCPLKCAGNDADVLEIFPVATVEKETAGSNDNTTFYSSFDSSCDIMSYGPPSGSSRIDSVTMETASNNDDKCQELDASYLLDIQEHLPSERLACDWFKYYLPGRVRALGCSDDVVLFCDESYLYFSFSSSEEACKGWKKKKLLVNILELFASFKNDIIFQSDEETFKLDKQKLIYCGSFSYESLSQDCLYSCLDEDRFWTLEKDGTLLAKLLSSEEENLQIVCAEFLLTSVVSRSMVTWALLDSGAVAYRIGVAPSAPYGISWGFMVTHPFPVKCIHLSNFDIGWMIDSEWQIFFRVLVKRNHPQGMDNDWWMMEQSEFMMVSDEYFLSSTDSHLWISDKGSSCSFVHSLASITGHRWHLQHEGPWHSICAEGIFGTFGSLLCLNKDWELFAFTSSSNSLLPIELPEGEKCQCVASRPEAIWILTNSGKIFIRTGLSINSNFGLHWVELDMTEIADVSLSNLSLGVDVVWAVDKKGMVFLRQGPLTPPSDKGLTPGWLCVDTAELKHGAVFSKVFAGNSFNLVWGLDVSNRIYVREAVFQELSTGTSWILVPGMLAVSLTITDDRVFVLTKSGSIFERVGISSSNCVGDTWKKIPLHSVQFLAITASVDSELWGLSSGREVWRHTSETFVNGLPSGFSASEGISEANSDLEEWEIV